jgi:hypothetical protein
MYLNVTVRIGGCREALHREKVPWLRRYEAVVYLLSHSQLCPEKPLDSLEFLPQAPAVIGHQWSGFPFVATVVKM